MKNVKIYLFLAYLLVTLSVSAESVSEKSSSTFVLHSRFDRSSLDRSYMNNGSTLDSLHRALDTITDNESVDIITIVSFSSPDGNSAYNNRLSQTRAKEVYDYLKREYPHIGERIVYSGEGENWRGLLDLTIKDTQMPYRTQALSIIDTDLDTELRKRRLISLAQGQTWRYASKNMFKYLRTTYINVIISEQVVAESSEIQTVLPTEEPAQAPVQEQVVETVSPKSKQYYYIRPIAIKTNLLFDAVGALNIELEVPLSKRFSVAAQFISPWWLWSTKQNCFEVQYGTVELRYWLKPNYKYHQNIKTKNPLAGWFVGAYYGVGLYDLEYNKKGYQGETYLSAGISAGYSAPLTRSFNMEFSLSGGYVKSDYRYYEAKQDALKDWHLIKQYDGNFSYYGLTGAKVSLVWYPKFKKEVRR